MYNSEPNLNLNECIMLSPSLIEEKKLIPGSIITPVEDMHKPGETNTFLFKQGVSYKVKQFYINKAGQGSLLVESEVGDWGIHFDRGGGAEFFRLVQPKEKLNTPQLSWEVLKGLDTAITTYPISLLVYNHFKLVLPETKIKNYLSILNIFKQGNVANTLATRGELKQNYLNYLTANKLVDDAQHEIVTKRFEFLVDELTNEGFIVTVDAQFRLSHEGERFLAVVTDYISSKKQG